MSRRFGRNQRRRAREALASAQAAHALAAVEARELRRARDRSAAEAALLRRQMDAVRKALGDVVILPAVSMPVTDKELLNYVETGLRVAPMAPIDWSESTVEQMATRLEIQTIDVLEASVERIPGWAKTPHFRLTTSRGGLAYAVDLGALAQLDRPEAVARLAELVAHEFHEALRRRWGR